MMVRANTVGPNHTIAIEGYFCIFKRGIKDIYQHSVKKH